jgi:hypothetical protein
MPRSRGKCSPGGHWALQAIAPVLKPHLLAQVGCGRLRDVTLTSNEEKSYARMLETRLREIVEELGILDSAQHGFRKGLSCETVAVDVCHRVSQVYFVFVFVYRAAGACAQGQVVSCILGFQKAFPHTWRARLVAKLRENGIVGDLLTALLRSGALNYVRYVRVKGATGDRLIVDERGLSRGTRTQSPAVPR